MRTGDPGETDGMFGMNGICEEPSTLSGKFWVQKVVEASRMGMYDRRGHLDLSGREKDMDDDMEDGPDRWGWV